ncbi:hypothetical protein Lesp02_32970 [Lentzea sp. NBRC 105346]|uniref:phosphotransferase n=1 Tax=Lentzea sp. NBRC 105346 TaxID=3032205 RepID=UPI0024A36B95|nr:phosphotransferase [Lentzea sp. NBRC 105346]GLZ31109.1 hypothetical protein Lesp02_32970 [Lentzea sp. NBRC 105346]
MSASPAVRAAVSVAAAHGLRVSAPVVLRDLSNTLIWLRPAPVVARVAAVTAVVRADVAAYLARDLAVSAYLADRGFPVVGGSAELPPGPHVRDGFTLSFNRYVPVDSSWTPSPADFAVLLAELHDELAGYPGPLPSRLPFDDILGVDPSAVLPDEPSGIARPLHGDAHPGNVLMTPAGPVWNDFEDTWRGPVEWDLACLRNTQRLDGAAAVAAYPGDYSAAAVEAWYEVRRLHTACWLQLF